MASSKSVKLETTPTPSLLLMSFSRHVGQAKREAKGKASVAKECQVWLVTLARWVLGIGYHFVQWYPLVELPFVVIS